MCVHEKKSVWFLYAWIPLKKSYSILSMVITIFKHIIYKNANHKK